MKSYCDGDFGAILGIGEARMKIGIFDERERIPLRRIDSMF